MQIGGAVGALVGRWLPATRREKRILLVAGIAAGMAAVFRTPLGAALLATEMLYRDDFESDALIPAILASVVAYSVVISIFGETTLFGHQARFPFVATHLVLYGLLAVLLAAAAVPFLRALRGVQRISARLPVPFWARRPWVASPWDFSAPGRPWWSRTTRVHAWASLAAVTASPRRPSRGRLVSQEGGPSSYSSCCSGSPSSSPRR